MPGASKIKEERTLYVSAKCLTGTLEIKVASAMPGTWNGNSKYPVLEKLSQKLLDMEVLVICKF